MYSKQVVGRERGEEVGGGKNLQKAQGKFEWREGFMDAYTLQNLQIVYIMCSLLCVSILKQRSK